MAVPVPTRRRAGRVAPALGRAVTRVGACLLSALAALFGLATPAAAAPWGANGADYDGVLCRLGSTDVPLGAWTVNGTVKAYSTRDVSGQGALQQPAPLTGTPGTMVPGQAGYSAADIATVAYLLHAGEDATGARAAEISATVASVSGGSLQAQCLGQAGTSTAGASAVLGAARRYAGPYRVEVDPPAGVIPGRAAQVGVTVRSAAGAGVPGLDVTVTAGSSTTTAVTDRDGIARADVTVPPAAAVAVTASAAVPTDVLYLTTTPPSVAAAPLTTVTGAATLRPVLHPKPTVQIDSDRLVLAQGTLRPVVRVGGTFGYSGTGEVTLFGPVQPAGSAPCSSIGDATLARARVAWQDTFTFRGDAAYRSVGTPQLTPGCYGVRGDVTTTDSVPPEKASSGVVGVTVASLSLGVSSPKAAAPGGLRATVTGTNPGRATVRASVAALGPLPVGRGACTGDFSKAEVAGASDAAALPATGGQLRATVAVPDVKAVGCYALVTRSEVSLDGRTARLSADPAPTATTAVLRPTLSVTTAATSAEQGRPMTGTVQLSGTFGFAGTVTVRLVQGTTLPITGCRDATFPTPATAPAEAAGDTSRVTTKGDGGYPFRSPATPRNACYSVVASFTLDQNAAVTARSGTAGAATAFLAGVRPNAGAGTVVQQPGEGGVLRAVVTYLVVGLLILGGCGALFARTFRRERDLGDEEPLWRWWPNRSDDQPRPPRPGDGTRPRPMPTSEPPGLL